MTNMNPLEQFRIYTSVMLMTNIVVILISGSIIYNMIIWLTKSIGSRWNIIVQSVIGTVIGLKSGKELVPMIYTIFSVIIITNVMGLIPYGFTATTHMSMTMSISLTIMIGITIMGNRSVKFYSIFIPSGTPIYLVPLIVGIEVISYISRVFSLALRLTANISAGHCLIGVISMISYTAISGSNIMGIIPIYIILLIGIYSLELLVASMQAYVFTLLVSSYIKDIETIKDGQ